MFYNDKINDALRVCYAAHHDQTDKAGVPYVFHPITVALSMGRATTSEIVTALLHDVIEDCPSITTQDWFNNYYAALDEDVKEALSLLTHTKDDSYECYIHKMLDNPIACKVKLADLEHNMCLARLNKITQADADRLMKYRKAYTTIIDNGSYRIDE